MTKTTLRHSIAAGAAALMLAGAIGPSFAGPVPPVDPRGQDARFQDWQSQNNRDWRGRDYDTSRWRNGQRARRHDIAEFRRLEQRWYSEERQILDRSYGVGYPQGRNGRYDRRRDDRGRYSDQSGIYGMGDYGRDRNNGGRYGDWRDRQTTGRSDFDQQVSYFHNWAYENWVWAQQHYTSESQWREFTRNLEDRHQTFLSNLDQRMSRSGGGYDRRDDRRWDDRNDRRRDRDRSNDPYNRDDRRRGDDTYDDGTYDRNR